MTDLTWDDTEDERFSDVPLSQDSPPDEGDAKPKLQHRLRAHLTRPKALLADRQGKTPPNPIGLSVAHRVKARDLMMQSAYLSYQRRYSLHYTQGALRWQGINKNEKAWRMQCPNYADCSSLATWDGWNALDHFRLRDYFNGLRWRAGYTGTLLVHGVRVDGRWALQRGDLVIYGRGFPGEHVAVYIGGGLVISHGSESGPLKLGIRYRPDVLQVRRYF